ncbi:MAG: hypothetical protein PHD67_05015 [Oscillospiraceae bacterium]|nr:hypothetical protein [Oscillospiraceae bacterium]
MLKKLMQPWRILNPLREQLLPPPVQKETQKLRGKLERRDPPPPKKG